MAVQTSPPASRFGNRRPWLPSGVAAAASILLVGTWVHPVGGQSSHPAPAIRTIEVPGGTFRQGSDSGDAGHRSVEHPAHEVTVAAFSLSRDEVTVAEFRRFVAHTGYRTDAEHDAPLGSTEALGCFSPRRAGERRAGWVAGRSWRNPGFAQGEDHPVVCVSWRDAQTYIAWVREVTGLRYRLPTESEFEYANRVGSLTSGVVACAVNQADRRLAAAIRDWEAAVAACDDGYAFTAPVGRYPPNALDLRDLRGNASEWVQDCWHDDYEGAPADGRAWGTDDESCARRVIKGGDFVGSPDRMRPAHRSSIHPAFRTYHVGFRLALTISTLNDR